MSDNFSEMMKWREKVNSTQVTVLSTHEAERYKRVEIVSPSTAMMKLMVEITDETGECSCK